MARRISASAGRAGITPASVARIGEAFLEMIHARGVNVTDEHHPDFLHTGRTAVILLEDVLISDVGAIGAAVLYDSLRPEHHEAALRLAARFGVTVEAVLHELLVDPEDDGELIEALVTASDAARLVAVAERLDHARHLHLRDASAWAAFHRQFNDVFLPLAHRTHPQLAYRCDRWAHAFAQRHLPM